MNYQYRECERCIIKKKSMDEYRGGANMHCSHCKSRPDTVEEKAKGQELFFKKEFAKIFEKLKDEYDILGIALISNLVFDVEKQDVLAVDQAYNYLVIVKMPIEKLVLQEETCSGIFSKRIQDDLNSITIWSIHTLREQLRKGTIDALRFLAALKNDNFINYYYNSQLKEEKDTALCYLKLLTLASDRVTNKDAMKKEIEKELSGLKSGLIPFLNSPLIITVLYNKFVHDQLGLFESDSTTYNLLVNSKDSQEELALLYKTELERIKAAVGQEVENNNYKEEIMKYIISLAYGIKQVDLTEFFRVFSNKN